MKQRNTIQKKLVMEAVAALPNHPTADEVYLKIAEGHPSISKGTVYRILNSLVHSKTLLKLSMADTADRFDLDTHLHYHLVCVHCGKFLDIELPGMPEVIRKIEDSTDFQVDSYNLVFTGICKECYLGITKDTDT